MRWMERAVALARASVGLASPNPQVGCVLVRDGVLIGEGAHVYELRDHAEIVALKQAGDAARGATAYVTLEPCSHHGRTGPCADALIAAGIARCVVATADPNPQVSGRGLARLQAAGIETLVGVLQESAREMNDAFAFSIQHGRPFCTLKAALSVEGHLAPPPAERKTSAPHWLTGPESRTEVQRMRHGSDALITGIGTVLADDPALTDRTGRPRRRPLLRVVLDSELRIPLSSQLVRSAQGDVLVVCGDQARGGAGLEAAGVEVLRVRSATGRLDLAAVLGELARRQILSVLVEAGSHVNGAFLAEGLIQKAVLFYSETELGEGAVPFAEGGVSPFLLEQRMRRVQRTLFGTDACVTGYLDDPWEA
ncbi:bifunctional diaminohydroxyphosphoribosylaminopyrimidine deaminase/5-amino-6-(5-phosphoribosylamino)uracil reductase RibD [Granulicella sp. WH15]|nr:bifunctional diaminohydroxyphosphoribosylaminopyrimidine deaminase/5-amino-6-(5-phosphoribosylamino)uracil reductase RibD [Granulicella sp. WH15]